MLAGDVVFAGDGRSCFGTEDQILHGPRAGAPVDVLFGETWSDFIIRPAGSSQVDRVASHVIADRQPPHDLLQVDDFVTGEHFRDFNIDVGPRDQLTLPAYQDRLSRYLRNLAGLNQVVGRWSDSVATMEEAVRMRRDLSASYPDVAWFRRETVAAP